MGPEGGLPPPAEVERRSGRERRTGAEARSGADRRLMGQSAIQQIRTAVALLAGGDWSRLSENDRQRVDTALSRLRAAVDRIGRERGE